MTGLERALAELGRELEVPPAPDLVPVVLARIEPQAAAARPRPRRWVLVVAATVLAALVATLAIPDARSALLRILRIGGEQIELVDALPEVTPAQAELDLEPTLGARVTIERARRDAGFDLRELETRPDRVYLGDRGTVWFLYGLPSSVRLLVAQTPLHSVDEILFLKKLASPETRVEAVDVDGAQGFLLTGEPHFVLLVDAAGEVVEETARLARDVLVWERDGVAYRLEGDFTRDEALALAQSLR
ncbi:MAG TPA: hypothetical protein VFR38_10360 [Gaiellaceae bacterium]|nr:hypothetical protein [Gaiellaceae bacterium]